MNVKEFLLSQPIEKTTKSYMYLSEYDFFSKKTYKARLSQISSFIKEIEDVSLANIPVPHGYLFCTWWYDLKLDDKDRWDIITVPDARFLSEKNLKEFAEWDGKQYYFENGHDISMLGWDKILGFDVIIEYFDRYSPSEYAASIISEMTLFGWTMVEHNINIVKSYFRRSHWSPNPEKIDFAAFEAGLYELSDKVKENKYIVEEEVNRLNRKRAIELRDTVRKYLEE